MLHRAIVKDVETLIDDLVERTRVGRGDIHCVVAAGNTAMLHFLLGIQADLIRLSPFVPSATGPPPVRAAEIGLRIHPRGLLYTLPMVGSFVGGDITAGILVSGMHESEELSLLLDIGTNGEVVLGNREFLVASSASAGPAFEGGSISCGMRATCGAIDSIRMFREGRAISATTVDGCPPVGLCGTGLIDALSEMVLAGVVDRAGCFRVESARDHFRVSEADDRLELLLVSAEESGGGRDVIMSQADIENLIRTNAAIYAAADSLVQSAGFSFDEIQKICIAGAFGNKLDLSSCITIGLLPDVPIERIQFIGNSSVAGAKRAMLSRHMFEEVNRIRERITYQELMVDPAYMEKFTSACFLPHTDLARFPSVAKRLEEGVSRARSADALNKTWEGNVVLRLSIAIAGKGGTGKTTFAALLVRAFREMGTGAILAVDADPNSNLAEALGVEPGRPLGEIREQSSNPEGSPPSGIGRARAIEDEIQREVTEADGFDLITMGRGEGPRCYCYVNNLLRKSLDALSSNYEVVVMDNEAGMEHLFRRTTNNMDFLMTVVSPTSPSIRAAKRILALSRQLPVRIEHRTVLVNRVGSSGLREEINRALAELDAERPPNVPQDNAVERVGVSGGDVFTLPDQTPALVAVRSAVETARAALSMAGGH